MHFEHTAEMIDRSSGQMRPAHIFVAVPGCSYDTYAEALWTQPLANWLGARARALALFGGVPAAVVPDNFQSGVVRGHRYDPDLHRTYPAHHGLRHFPAHSVDAA